MSKHTPGPWTVGWNENETLSILGLGREVVAFPAVADINPYHAAIDRRDANSRLISAAPELLQALQRLVQVYVKERNSVANRHGYEGDADQFLIVRFAKDAIAKAEGR